MYAIIEDSGTQIKVATGDRLDVDLRELPEGTTTLTFDRVLLVGGEGEARIGTPYLDGASVTAEIEGEHRAKKIDVIKFKRRKGYRRKMGHRQRYLRVRIGAIAG